MRSAALILIAAGAIASAAPQVEIRAQAQLTLQRVRMRDSGMVEVTGRLADKLTGDGLEGQRVQVELGGSHQIAVTAPDGTFHVDLPGSGGPEQVAAMFAGSHDVDSTQVAVMTDPTRAQVELAIKKVSDDKDGAKLRVDAVADDQRVELPLLVEIAQPGKLDWHPLHVTATAGTPFLVTRKDAGGPGLYLVRASYAGDDLRQHASVEGTLELVTGTTTTMAVGKTELAYEDELVATGKVTDDDGHPVARASVALTAGDKRLAQAATGEDGGYHFKIEAELLGDCPARPCQFAIQAQGDPGATFARPSRSAPAVIRVRAPQPVPVSYTVAAFVITGLAAGGFFAARSKPWQRFRRPAPPAEVPSAEGEHVQERGGLVVAKPGIVSTLRGRTDDAFTGVVRDTVRGRPIAQAIVRLSLGDTEREVRTSGDGAFALEHLGVGEWQAEVAASGHVTERFVVSVPHRGELRGVRVDLVPVRERVFQLYRRAAEPALPEPRLWGVWSPRQIVDHVRARRPSPALAELTDFVEEIYFSARVAAETVLPHASERVDRAIQERQRR
ncbi:MAG: carboxypeptidase-like regulatory domain-containing protein [Acidobacteriota bacterium]